ncbi:sensor histidine kinase [Spartinivicinus poritis]|uniref:histidine kinase n=1 Tax=Spartinivicinus poritis TaxID=2994640 RepID=A0ABT5U9R3_9GAMM|nr:ATP-binding protein [Spartinivicinus sp. A2-2]MDE1462751.1 ATP-binding protein [Spartinivicinus sp. A2-2]
MNKQLVLNTIVFSAATLSLLLGIVVLIGWHTKTVMLIQLLPTLVPMQYNTALGFILCGIALYFVSKNSLLMGTITGGIAGIIGFLTLIQYIFGTDIGLDELFITHYITVETSHPGRMAPNTAICFSLFAVACILYTLNIRKIQLSGVLTTIIFSLGFTALIGYLIDIKIAYSWGKYTQMAVHTAVGFMLLGIGFTALSWLREFAYNDQAAVKIPPLMTGYAVALAIALFFIDLNLPLGVAAAVIYILLVLYSWFIPSHQATYILALVASTLLIFGYFFSQPGSPTWIVVINRCLAFMAIWVTAYLLIKIKLKEVELKARNHELEQFAYIASHDLQEPLRTIMSYSELITTRYNKILDETGKKSLDFIAQSSNHMSMLIKGLLDYSRIGFNKKPSLVNCNTLLESIQDDLHPVIQIASATLEVSELPTIKGYPAELQMLFESLISNAIKFRRHSVQPKVKVFAYKENNCWKFIVQDNGIGIEDNVKNKIFVIFQRLHKRNEYEGIGIGLACCKKVVDLHKGQIWVDSNPDKGSSFSFTIPN